MSRIDEIKGVLLLKSPLTARQIGAELRMTAKAVTYHIGILRKYEHSIRVHSYDMRSPTRKERRYELGTERDAPFPHGHRPPSQIKRIKNPQMTRQQFAEYEIAERLRQAAKQIKPFRHWQDAALFGEAA